MKGKDEKRKILKAVQQVWPGAYRVKIDSDVDSIIVFRRGETDVRTSFWSLKKQGLI